jgi:hypothetical protein
MEADHNQIQLLTETVGSLNQLAFLSSFFILFTILLSTGIRKRMGLKRSLRALVSLTVDNWLTSKQSTEKKQSDM